MNPEHVWCEVSYKDDVDYQMLANERGMINGNLGDRDGIDTFESVQRHRWS